MKLSVFTVVFMLVLGSLPLFAQVSASFDAEDDEQRFVEMSKAVESIFQAITAINQLAAADQVDQGKIDSLNAEKGRQADEIINICSHYFLCQRIKLPFASKREDAIDRYRDQLDNIHQLMRAAMRCKMASDLRDAETLKSLAASFKAAYKS